MAQLPVVFELPKSVTDNIKSANDLCLFSQLWIEANEAYQVLVADGVDNQKAHEIVEIALDEQIDAMGQSLPDQYNEWLVQCA
ncbi:hypothetical protein AB4138_23015 [Vibrio sp. 10N.286.52.C3]